MYINLKKIIFMLKSENGSQWNVYPWHNQQSLLSDDFRIAIRSDTISIQCLSLLTDGPKKWGLTPRESRSFSHPWSVQTTEFYVHGSVHHESNLIIFQQDATYSVYYISVGRSTCFGCWHPSSGAHTTSGID